MCCCKIKGKSQINTIIGFLFVARFCTHAFNHRLDIVLKGFKGQKPFKRKDFLESFDSTKRDKANLNIFASIWIQDIFNVAFRGKQMVQFSKIYK